MGVLAARHDMAARAAPRAVPGVLALGAALLLSGCGTLNPQRPARADPDVVRERIAALLPPATKQKSDWAADLSAALEALDVEPTDAHLCAVIAVAEQESGLQTNPVVPGLPAIAQRELEAKAARFSIPRPVLRAALAMRSPDGRTYRERIDVARTEKDLSDLYEDFIGEVPLGRRLFADLNPVRTAGPMQVSIEFAERHARAKRYPFPLAARSSAGVAPPSASTPSERADPPGTRAGSRAWRIRDEVFTRRGGLYFGAAHLLDYPALYTDTVYRFADFNAGQYASRNAAFQNAVALVARTLLVPDGDLLIQGGESRAVSQTELAVRRVARELALSHEDIRSDLEQGRGQSFEQTRTWQRIFERADRALGRPAPRAAIPRIALKGPKITRRLTTEWFAMRVAVRYDVCRRRGVALASPERGNRP
jgi:hypothetical protein